MAPNKSRSRKLAATAMAPVENVSPVPSTAPTDDQRDLHREIVTMKEAITAPFMIYDAETRRIVPNPSYNRTLLSDVRRLQSIALSKLRSALHANISYTPKELLYELEATLFCMCASAAVASNGEPLRYFTRDAEADAAMPQLESFLARHNAPAKTTVTMAYCLTEGTSHDILTSFLSMLQQRVEKELDPAIDRRRTEDEHKALRSTKNNVHDIAQLVRDTATAFHSIETPSQVLRRQPQSDPTQVDMARSPAANSVPAQMIDEAFYKVLRWVMAVDTDRRALKVAATVGSGQSAGVGGGGGGGALASGDASAAVAAAVASAVSGGDSTRSAVAAVVAASTKGFAKVVDYDPFTGHATLERVSEAQRWGLLLNAKGLLVGLENDLRNSSAAGERLYDAVQQQSGEAGGLAIYEVNRRRIRPVHLSEEALESSRAEVLRKLRDSLTQPAKTLHLMVERRKQADLTSPHEVLYEVSYQGGEGGVGQRCLLMLERASTSISWGLKLKYLAGAPAALSDFSPNVRLSAAAKNFLFDMRGRVRVLKMNNKDMATLSAAEMKDLVSGALILTLNLQVTDANGEVPEGVVTAAEAEEPAQISAESDEAHELPRRKTEKARGDKEKKTMENDEAEEQADAVEEAEVTAVDEAMEAMSAVQAELDDVAASIADEFLLQHDRAAIEPAKEVAAPLLHADTTASLPEGNAEAEEDGGFEELDWAKPTTTIGVPDSEEAVGEGEEAAEQTPLDNDGTDADHNAPLVEEVDEHAAERALLKEFNLLPENGTDSEERVEASDEAKEEEEDNAELKNDEGDANDAEDKALEEGEREGEATEAKEILEEDAAAKKPRKGKKAKGEKAAKQKKKKTNKASTSRGRKSKASAAAAEDAEEEEANADGEAAAETTHEVEGEATLVDSNDVLPDNETRDSKEAIEEEAPKTEKEKAVAEKVRKGRGAKKTLKEAVKKSQRSKAESTSGAAEADSTEDGTEREAKEGIEAGDEPTEDAAEGGDADAPVKAAVDVPLVDLPPTAAEEAIEAGTKNAAAAKKKKGKTGSRSAKKETEAQESAEAEAQPVSASPDHEADAAPNQMEDTSSTRVSLNELMRASPLTFENDVRLEKFDGSLLELGRTSVTSPWNIKVAFAGDDIIMTKLPPIPTAQLQHPFLRSLGAGPQGEVKWVVEGLNGQDLSMLNKSLKTKALDAIKGSTKLTFALKALRK